MRAPILYSDTLSRPAAALLATMALAAAGSMAGCGDDEDANAVDAGLPGRDAATPDVVVADAGASPDLGTAETGPRPDAGYYCTSNGSETVDGMPVPVPEASEAPRAGNNAASVRCIDRRPPSFPMNRSVCFTQCAEFFGFQPTPGQVREIEIDVFRTNAPGGSTVDPSYDFITRRERSPSARLGVGAAVLATQAPQCTSGYQVEIGYLDTGGTEMTTEVSYTFRVRSRAVGRPTWATTYVWNFVRRLDEANQIGAQCSSNEARLPEIGRTFPLVATSVINQALQVVSSSVAGASDLFDGRGLGYAMVETRDCGFGSLTQNLTVGFAPAAVGGGYVSPAGAIDPAATDTSERALFFALGLGTTTSSAATTVRSAVGVNREGACTEAFGGLQYPVYPDSVTFVRTGRETTIQ